MQKTQSIGVTSKSVKWKQKDPLFFTEKAEQDQDIHH